MRKGAAPFVFGARISGAKPWSLGGRDVGADGAVILTGAVDDGSGVVLGADTCCTLQR